MIGEGVMGGKFRWGVVVIGVFIAVVVEIIRIPVLPVAIGLYLPLELSSCIMIGGLVRLYIDKKKMSEEVRRKKVSKGILFSSGMIAGEGLIGIILAILTVLGVTDRIDMSGVVNTGTIGSFIIFIVMILCLVRFSLWSKDDEEK